MSELSTDVRIFISSTFVDLKKLRVEVATRLREVFGARLLIMETFGSDEAPPEISSVRRVSESDVFVGYTPVGTGQLTAQLVSPSQNSNLTRLREVSVRAISLESCSFG
jgi:hypothetical protein